ncbi:MAG TPA: hypothetical protein VFG72_05855 [Marmoricola sp.]|nr:hypothetical protein [Marmoricola sp.]
MDAEPAVTVVHATTAHWEGWRELRLRALALDPDAFGSTLERERDLDEAFWRGWLEHPAVLARLHDAPAGMGALPASTNAPASSPPVSEPRSDPERGC